MTSRMNKPPLAIAQKWAAVLNEWYSMAATGEELLEAFAALKHDAKYISTYFKKANGNWVQGLDTADREGLAHAVRQRRLEKGLSLPPGPRMTDKTVQLTFTVPSILDTPSEVMRGMKYLLLTALAQYQPTTVEEAALKACLLAPVG